MLNGVCAGDIINQMHANFDTKRPSLVAIGEDIAVPSLMDHREERYRQRHMQPEGAGATDVPPPSIIFSIIPIDMVTVIGVWAHPAFVASALAYGSSTAGRS
jgi:hypothetical protein